VRAEALDGRVIRPGEVATVRPLDFYDVSAKVGQVARREGRGNRVLPGDHANAV
jgi:hypothetical protein